MKEFHVQKPQVVVGIVDSGSGRQLERSVKITININTIVTQLKRWMEFKDLLLRTLRTYILLCIHEPLLM